MSVKFIIINIRVVQKSRDGIEKDSSNFYWSTRRVLQITAVINNPVAISEDHFLVFDWPEWTALYNPVIKIPEQ